MHTYLLHTTHTQSCELAQALINFCCTKFQPQTQLGRQRGTGKPVPENRAGPGGSAERGTGLPVSPLHVFFFTFVDIVFICRNLRIVPMAWAFTHTLIICMLRGVVVIRRCAGKGLLGRAAGVVRGLADGTHGSPF